MNNNKIQRKVPAVKITVDLTIEFFFRRGQQGNRSSGNKESASIQEI